MTESFIDSDNKSNQPKVVPLAPLLNRAMPSNGYIHMNGEEWGFISVYDKSEVANRMAELVIGEVEDFTEQLRLTRDQIRTTA